MTRLEKYLALTESRRWTVGGLAAALILVIGWLDWMLPQTTVGYLYLIPVVLSSAALSRGQILAMAILCAYLREAFDPFQEATRMSGGRFLDILRPFKWAPGSIGRMVVVSIGFAMTGFFIGELNRRRRLLYEYLKEREEQIRLRQEAERQIRILIETSPLAILMLNASGRVALANESARQLLGLEQQEELQGGLVEPYLPILPRLLHSHHSETGIRTSVECRGVRRNGDVFLAHVWLSTYRSSEGPGLAAVIWDASENLRDREGAGLDSMMATSRVLIGALSHEIRNLASAAASAHSSLALVPGVVHADQYQALGALIQGLEKIASSGLRAASAQEAVTADLGTVLDETRIVIEPSLREAGVETLWDIGGSLPLVQADHHSLLQVFLNLWRNSQSALEGCRTPRLHISARLEKDLVVVRFCDNGPGVPNPEELFRPFQPGAHSAGLGLYISRAILRAHGGGLRYESRENGCCFAVELWPVEKSFLKADGTKN